MESSATGAPRPAPAAGERLTLVIAWSGAEVGRIGEVAVTPEASSAWMLGRGEPVGGDRVRFVRQRPGKATPAGPLFGAGISRDQLRLRARADAILVERIGRCPMLVNGQPAEMEALVHGDTLLLKGHLLLLCVRRPEVLPASRDFPGDALGAFGEPDALGILGESAATWRLREQIAFDAKADNNVLVSGESGTGKELCARAVHALSRRRERPFVARNAATIPPALVDAELFGNVKNYPNPGMPERPGLVAQADGGTLFLDEVGELPQEAQAHLLRVLDAGGEYHRLGEATSRRANVRLVAATNRAPTELKHDLLARLTLRIAVPSLAERREDIPLLVRHLLRKAARETPEIGLRFFGDGAPGEPRVDPALIEHLLRRPFPANVREVEAVLWSAMRDSPGDRVLMTDEIAGGAPAAPVATAGTPRSWPPARPRVSEPTPDEIRESLRRHDDNLTRAAQALGLPSRFALYRLIKKLGIEVHALRDEPEARRAPPRRG